MRSTQKKGLVCVSLQKTGSSTLLHSIQSPTKAHTSTCDARGGQQLCRAAAERVEEVYPIIDRALTHKGLLPRLDLFRLCTR